MPRIPHLLRRLPTSGMATRTPPPTSGCEARRLGVIAAGALLGLYLHPLTVDAQSRFEGPLAAVPCHGEGVVEVDNGYVGAEENVVCTSRKEVRIGSGFEARPGSEFRALAGPHVGARPWAKTNCRLGDPDCNVCAVDVEEQFFGAFSGTHEKNNRGWEFSYEKTYPSANQSPSGLWTDGLHRHVQGFVHTNHPTVPFAGTHSDNTTGTVFFVENDGGLELAGLHTTNSGHPSGASIIGDYLLFSENEFLKLHKVDAHTFKHVRTKKIPPPEAFNRVEVGGGIGMVKLRSGAMLLLASGPGGPTYQGSFPTKQPPAHEAPPRHTQFYYVNGTEEGTRRAPFGDSYLHITLKLEIEHLGDTERKGEHRYSENLTVIPECGTGDIYVIHTSQEEPAQLPTVAPKHDGYWRLDKVVWTNAGPRLEMVGVETEPQTIFNIEKCHHRSSATVWVNENHEMEFFCHESRQRDRVAFKKETFNFTHRRPK